MSTINLRTLVVMLACFMALVFWMSQGPQGCEPVELHVHVHFDSDDYSTWFVETPNVSMSVVTPPGPNEELCEILNKKNGGKDDDSP